MQPQSSMPLCACGCGQPHGPTSMVLRGHHWKMRGPSEVFWPHVTRIDDADSCWDWTGPQKRRGYGTLRVAGKQWPAHRYSYWLACGVDPGDQLVCHRCDNPPCVRPSHLFLGDTRANALDAQAKGRLATGDRSGARLHIDLMPRGEQHGMAKLTEAQAREIRYRANVLGEPADVLATEFHIDYSSVTNIATGRTWRHLSDSPTRPVQKHTAVTPEIVLAIRARYHANHVTLAHLATEYDLSLKTVWRIVKRLSWQDVP